MLTLRGNTKRWSRVSLFGVSQLLFLLVLTSCSTTPELQRIASSPTRNVDLSGSWVRRRASDGSSPATQPPSGELTTPTRQRNNRPPQKSKIAKVVTAMLMDGLYVSAKKLRVTQESAALFVKYDLAKVTEYRYGELRDATIGPFAVLRTSGWENDRYLSRSLTDERVLIEERFYLSANGLQLHRDVTIEGRDVPLRTLAMVYERVP